MLANFVIWIGVRDPYNIGDELQEEFEEKGVLEAENLEYSGIGDKGEDGFGVVIYEKYDYLTQKVESELVNLKETIEKLRPKVEKQFQKWGFKEQVDVYQTDLPD